jgi:aryl-alcohol dehydrogenase-like predicted oxidoreductase
VEREILAVTRELGIAITAYGVLSRGLLSFSQTAGAGDFRAHLPRFKGDNLRQNQKVLEEFAWAFHKGADIFPVIGARRRSQLADAWKAAELPLSGVEMDGLEAIFAPGRIAGTRYDAAQMRMLDSEKVS